MIRFTVKQKYIHLKNHPSTSYDREGLNVYTKEYTPFKMDGGLVLKHSGVNALSNMTIYSITELSQREMWEISEDYPNTNVVKIFHGMTCICDIKLMVCGGYFSVEEIYGLYTIIEHIISKGLCLPSLQKVTDELTSKCIGEWSIDYMTNITLKDSFTKGTKVFSFKDMKSMANFYLTCKNMFEID